MRRLVGAVVAVGVAVAVAGEVTSAAHARGVAGSRAVYSYAHAVRETVHVRAPFDSDHDGVFDSITVDIVRPSEPAAQRANTPVIMDASPYYTCCGRGNELQRKSYAPDGTPTGLPLFYDNYFVPRGYAVAEVDLPGSARSTGCGDFGGPNQVLGAKAVIDWLNGRGRGTDPRGRPVTASWSDGRVGMIGKSWDGSIANGVAATGVPGLRTIVPISAISSWYDYTRYGGVLRDTEYVSSVSQVVNDRPEGVCEPGITAMQKAADDRTGSYNAFWAQRDYRRHVDRVRAAVFAVQGLHDTNVVPGQFASWWGLLAAHHVPRKVWLSQDGHVDPFDFRRGAWVDTLHRWFDHWLMGIDNGVTAEPQADVQRADGRWVQQPRWPASGTTDRRIELARLGGTALRQVTDAPALTERRAVADPGRRIAGRTVLATGPLRRPLSVAGSPALTLRIRSSAPDTELSARLVDYGRQRRVDFDSAGAGISTLTDRTCWGSSSADDSACYLRTAPDYVTSSVDVLTRGWLSAAHHVSLSRRTPLVPGRWYTVTVRLNATDAVIAAGHRFAVVLTLSDTENTVPSTTGATVTVDPRTSALTLPVTGRAPAL